MPEGNELVAAPQSDTTAVTGIGIAESANDLANGIANGDWVEAGLGAVGAGLEVLSMVIDPVGTVASYGVGWLIEHVQPLKEALDWFAGDPPVIRSFSETWGNVAAEVNTVAADMANEVTAGTAGWTGAAGDAYRGHSGETADALAGASSLADGISAGVMIMGEVVAAVREMVRELVAELVGRLITWALEAVATLGLGIPVIAAQAATAVSKLVSKIADFVRKLVKTIGNVTPRIRKVIDKLDEIIQKLAKLGRKADGGSPNSPKSPDAPGSPDGGTSPSSTTSPSGTSTSPDTGSTTPSSTKADGTTSPDSGTSSSGSTSSNGSNSSDTSPNRPRDNVDPRKDGRSNDGKCKGGDPIDLAMGEMLMTQTDLELPGTLPLAIRRTHLSSHLTGRSLGGSWASTFDQRLEFDTQGVLFTAEDGVLLVYPTPPHDGTAVMPVEGARHPLQRISDDEYALSLPPGLTLRFQSIGSVAQLRSIVDRNDNWIEFNRDSTGIVTNVTHSGGYRVAVDNDGTRITGLRLETGDKSIGLVRYGYDEDGRLTEVINSSGRAMRFDYDQAGRVVRWQDRNGEWYRYLYDPQGRCVRTEGSGGALTCTIDYSPGVTTYTNSVGHRTRYHFNDAMQLTSVVDALGNTTSTEWDRYDRPLVTRNALGHETRFQYDEMGNLVVLTRPDGKHTTATYNEWGQPATVTSPDGTLRRIDYDERGNIVALTDAGGAVTRLERDTRGNISQVIDPIGTVRRVESNAAGLPLLLTGPDNATTRYVRDVFGRVSQIIDPAGNARQMAWTVEGQLISHTMPDGSTERWSYDGEGNAVEHTNALGAVTRIETTHFDLVSAETTPDGSRMEYGYDSELRLASVTNSLGAVWRYEYDARGALMAETDFNGRTLRYERDAAGQLTARTNAMGQTIEFRRNPLGDVIERSTAEAAVRFEYDEAQRLIRAANGDVRLEFERDPVGRVIAETVNGRTVRSEYDAIGRRASRLTPTGALSRWEYHDADQPAQLHTAGRTLTFDYDPAGREIERLLDTGAVLTQGWDQNSRQVSQVVHTATGQGPRVVQQRTFQYRADGYISAVTDRFAGTRQYDLDPVGRIAAVRGSGWQEAYTYDSTGSVMSATSPVADSGGARQYSGTLLMTAGDLRFSYDRQGRMVIRQKKRLSRKPDTWHYEWNSEDQLVGVTTPDGTRWRYVYDPLGRRTAKEKLAVDGGVAERTDFTWDGSVLAEQVQSNGRATSWDWVPDTFEPVAQTERRTAPSQEWVDEQFYAIVTDIVGTPTELIDHEGQIAWQSHSTVWGEAIGRLAGSGYTPLRFPGQYFDDETGLNYNYFRYYDPAAGRFNSTDPLGINGGDDCHAYVVNPQTWIDPYGLGGALPRKWYDHSDGWRIGRDIFPIAGEHDFEFHVYRNGREVGIWGSEGWFDKHGRGIPQPGDVPPHIEGRLRNMSIDLLRDQGRLPAKGTADISGDKWKQPRLSKKCEGT